ncbi:MAG: acyl-CoA carboxylase subunit beta [Anaerolineae bacterium]
MTHNPVELTELRDMRAQALSGGGQERIEAQHAKGKLTARERLAALLDEGSFQEIGALATHNVNEFGMADKKYPGDGVVAGFGKIRGRKVAIYAQDFTVLGGSFSEVQSNKISRVMDVAVDSGIPIIALIDSGGARIQEGVRSLAAYGELFTRNVMASGVVPQIAVILGPSAGGAVYSPALMDFVIMVRKISHMFITGPDVIKTVTGEDVTFRDLGGTLVHNAKSGVAHLLADDEQQAFLQVKQLLSYLPPNNAEDPRRVEAYDDPLRMDDQLNYLAPEDSTQPYDMRQAIDRIVDRDSFFEIQPYYARNAIVGFGRFDGYVTGIVANQPNYLAGVLDIDSSDKIARFVRICDAYNIPLVTLVDCPGYLPGVEQEHHGIIRHGAKVIYAYCEATVPKISIVTRKAIGGAYIAMSSKQMRSDLAFAWPTAQIAVMGADGAVNILYRKQLAEAADPAALRAEIIAQYQSTFMSPYAAADMGQIDEVIEPRETRARLIAALDVLRGKVSTNPPKKHGLMPV